jgi:hypothetical protein
MRLDFEPISSIADAVEVLAVIEIRTLFYPSTYVGDLDWDEDQLLTSFLEQLDDPVAKADYQRERTAGILEAKGRLLSDLYALIQARHGALKGNSPFEWDFANGLLLQRRERTAMNAVALGYLWLSFYWLITSGKNYLVVEDDARDAFLVTFRRVFEQICCYAITGRSDSAIWYLGDSRSVIDFLRRLETVTAACRSGVVKRREQLEANQVGVNDAGVDVLAIELRNGEIRADALAYLVGATVQRAGRRNKVIGIDQITRFTSYFERLPLLAYKGVLAVPFARSENDALNCRDADCLYLSQDDLPFYLGRVSVENAGGHLRHAGFRMLRATSELKASLSLASNDESRAIDWA